MPVILKTPFNPGSADVDAKDGYPMAQIVLLTHNPLTFTARLDYEFGTASGDHYETWQRGAASPAKSIDLTTADLLGLWGELPEEGESVGVAMRRLCYQFLLDKKLLDGTIADNPPAPPPAETTDDSAAKADA